MLSKELWIREPDTFPLCQSVWPVKWQQIKAIWFLFSFSYWNPAAVRLEECLLKLQQIQVIFIQTFQNVSLLIVKNIWFYMQNQNILFYLTGMAWNTVGLSLLALQAK